MRTTKLVPCRHCAGRGCEPTRENTRVRCPCCAGGCYEPVFGDLGKTRTYESRPFCFNPGTRELTVTRKKSRTTYVLTEYEPSKVAGQEAARAWRVEKKDRYGKTCEKYYVLHDRPGLHRCTCDGFASEAVEKGNKAAWQTGEPVRHDHSYGCLHLDAVLLLLWDGLLDIPVEQPDWSEPELVSFNPMEG